MGEDLNAMIRDALEHARARFQCLADEFRDDECVVNWAMCSVDAERMERALAALSRSRAHEQEVP